MHKEHPVFEAPGGEDIIWRYMDLAKFISMLDKKALYFCRSDKFEDPFEGSLSGPSIMLRGQHKLAGRIMECSDGNIESYQEMKSRSTRLFRGQSFVNCWHINQNESAAMWKLYCQMNNGIAIKSNYSRLRECFAGCGRDVYIGKVKYIDYDSEPIPEENSFYPIVHKRMSFQHENELRAVVAWDGLKDANNIWRTSNEVGVSLSVDISALIQEIYVSPYSPTWFYEVVSSTCQKFGLEHDVKDSRLNEAPLF